MAATAIHGGVSGECPGGDVQLRRPRGAIRVAGSPTHVATLFGAVAGWFRRVAGANGRRSARFGVVALRFRRVSSVLGGLAVTHGTMDTVHDEVAARCEGAAKPVGTAPAPAARGIIRYRKSPRALSTPLRFAQKISASVAPARQTTTSLRLVKNAGG